MMEIVLSRTSGFGSMRKGMEAFFMGKGVVMMHVSARAYDAIAQAHWVVLLPLNRRSPPSPARRLFVSQCVFIWRVCV